IWSGLLARAGALPTGGRRTALIALVAVPLLVSIIGSTIGSGPVGAVASIGSAAFSAFAYLVATTSAEAITKLIGRIDPLATVTATEVAEQQDDAPAPVAGPLPRRTAGQALQVVGEEIAEQAADYLRSHGSPPERSHETTEQDGEETEVTASERPCERDRPRAEDASTERVLTAQERRRLEGRRNRERVARLDRKSTRLNSSHVK